MDTDFKLTSLSNTLLQDIAPAKAMAAAVVGIKIGSIGCLVPRGVYCEMLDKISVNALPNVPPWISGLLNFRGNLLPVFDLRVVLQEELADNDQKKRRLFIIDRGDKSAAVWIDSFPELKDSFYFQTISNPPALPQMFQRFVTEYAELDGQIWLSVNYAELFKALGQQQFVTMEMK